MVQNIYKVLKRPRDEESNIPESEWKIVAQGTMTKLAKKFRVDKTAIWQAARRGSHFLRDYKVVKTDEYTTR